jgi:hypothetical protein
MLIQKHVRSSALSDANFKSACSSAVCATKVPYCMERFTARQCSAVESLSSTGPSNPSGQNKVVSRVLGAADPLMNEDERRIEHERFRSLSVDTGESGVRETGDCGEGAEDNVIVLTTTSSISKRLTESAKA